MTNEEWYEEMERRHDGKDWSAIDRQAKELDKAYAESDAWHRSQNTGHVRFELRLWPKEPSDWASTYPEVMKNLLFVIRDGALQMEGGYYVVSTELLGAERYGEVEFSADESGLWADIDFRCKWPEPLDAASGFVAICGLWDANTDDGPPEGTIDKLAASLIEFVPGSSDQFLAAPSTRVKLHFGHDPTIDEVFSKISALELELLKQDYRAWDEIRDHAKSLLRALK